MAEKYRIKINDRLIGPLDLMALKKIYENGHISGDEEMQIFPDGEWKKFDDYSDIIKSLKREVLEDSGTIIRTNPFELNKDNINIEQKIGEEDKEQFKEFVFDKNENKANIEYEELEKKYTEKNESEDSTSKKVIIDKTVIIKKEDLEKFEETKILPRLENEGLKVEVETSLDENLLEELDEEDVNKIDTDEATQMINMNEVKLLRKEKKDSELALKNALEKEKEDESELTKISEDDASENETLEKKKEKKKMTPIVLFSFIAILGFLFFDEDEKKANFEPQLVNITSPVTYDVENSEKAKALYVKGVKEYRRGGYLNKVNASKLFKESVEYKINNNPALGFLVRVYGELIPNSANKKRGSRNLFNLIKIGRKDAFQDPNMAIGTAHFYNYAKKYQTASNVIENYLRISKPTLEVLALYLNISIEMGDLIQAEKIFKKLVDYQDDSLDVTLALSRYYNLDERYDEAKRVIKKGLKKFSSSVALMLELAGSLLREEKIKRYTKVLRNIEKLNYEANPQFYAKYLEYMALLSALNKDNKTAALLFKTALKLNNSSSLRGKLASLEIGGGKISEKLILESKAIDLIRRSKKLERQKKWNLAIASALEATNLGVSYLPAEINLIRLQIRRGYYEFSINKLEKLKEAYPRIAKINFYLIEALTKSNKLAEAQKLVGYVTNVHSNHESYYPVVARYYERTGKYLLAVKFLNQGISLYPLRDEDYFLMAKIYMKNRQYKDAKNKINEAIDLDPLNTDYISLYSKIVFELDGVETAVGYLREKLKDHVDSPKLLGNIATYYYESGQLDLFEETKNEILKLNRQDEDFYRFLVRSGKIEDNESLIIESAENLLYINPGDLDMRITLSNQYRRKRDYKSALDQLGEVEARLSTYPRINYFKAKIYVEMKQFKNALLSAELETKNNPYIYNGWYILGEVYRLIGKYKKSVKNLEKAISIKPKSVEALKSLGWIKLSESQFDVARELYLRAKKSAPNDPDIRKQLALIYRGIGQSGLAIEEYKTYLRLYPNAPDRSLIKSQINALSR